MTFLWPVMLIFLILIPLVSVFLLWMQRQRRRRAARFSELGLVQASKGSRPGIQRNIPSALFLLGLTVMVVAMARPQTVVSLPRLESTLILAFDVSGSMAADDMQPTRMEAAKQVARDFVVRQPSAVRIGVVAFSDGGIAVLSPTNLQEDILAAIDRLSPQRSTSLGSGIQASLNAIDGSASPAMVSSDDDASLPTPTAVPEGVYIPASIVLLTDGENTTSPDPLEAAHMAAQRGVRLYTIGIGSPAGTVLEVNGFSVHTRLDEATLQQISQITDGEYFRAESQEDLRRIYGSLEPQLVTRSEKMEVTSLLAGASLILLLVGGVFSLLWYSRLP
ncbi:MAG: VWA domain-containing protein [Anaerolineales bacterium]